MFKPYKYEENDFKLVAHYINEWSRKKSLKDIWEEEDGLEYVKDKIKDYLYSIYEGRCFYCKRNIEKSDAHIEHIICKSKYPIYSFHLKNLTLSCADCNSNKSGKEALKVKYTRRSFSYNNYPLKSKCYRIIHSYLDDYYKYIDFYNNIFYLAKGQSSKGLETIKACNLNRLGLIKINAKMVQNNLNREQGFTKKYLIAQTDEDRRLYKEKVDTLTSLINISNNSIINKFTQRVCQHARIISKLKEVSEKSIDNLLDFKDFVKEIDNINTFNRYISKNRKFQGKLSEKIKSQIPIRDKVTKLELFRYLESTSRFDYQDEIKYLNDVTEFDNLLKNFTNDTIKKWKLFCKITIILIPLLS